MSRPQWWLDAAELDALALCEYLAARSPNAVPDHVDDFTPPSGRQDLKRLIDFAVMQHYVRTDPGYQDLAHAHDAVVITPIGARYLESVHERRGRRGERVDAARQGLLNWAYEYALAYPQ